MSRIEPMSTPIFLSLDRRLIFNSTTTWNALTTTAQMSLSAESRPHLTHRQPSHTFEPWMDLRDRLQRTDQREDTVDEVPRALAYPRCSHQQLCTGRSIVCRCHVKALRTRTAQSPRTARHEYGPALFAVLAALFLPYVLIPLAAPSTALPASANTLVVLMSAVSDVVP